MKVFYFDFVAVPRTWLWVSGALLLTGACALGGVVAFERMVLSPQIETQRQLVAQQRDKMGSKPIVSTMKPEVLAASWRAAQSASVQLNIPWSRFFAALGESASRGDVALISIEPDAQKGQVVMVAEARNFEGMLNFVSAMQLSDEFAEVALQSHLINRLVPEQPVRFRLSTKWKTKP